MRSSSEARGGRRALLATLAAGLAGCGDVPRPFWGNPGRSARQLAMPLAIRLAVLPAEGLVPGADASLALAEALAAALQQRDLPAVATAAPLPLDWRLATVIEAEGGRRRARFSLLDADGALQGSFAGPPLPEAAWRMAGPALPPGLAAAAAEGVERLLAAAQGARLAMPVAGGGPRRIRLLPIRGAPGDGAAALPARMREFLAAQGFLVQEAAAEAEFGLTAEVTLSPPRAGQQVVELQWIVTRRDGLELGRVVQVEAVPAGRLDRFWGDIAYVAAEQASGGVVQIIRNAEASSSPASAPLAAPGPGGGLLEATAAPAVATPPPR
ncbi:MAG: hypothetical protein N2588_01765 [Rhodovarius sp.]|nr:hypothetical protein [Rhodovarius sp.]